MRCFELFARVNSSVTISRIQMQAVDGGRESARTSERGESFDFILLKWVRFIRVKRTQEKFSKEHNICEDREAKTLNA